MTPQDASPQTPHPDDRIAELEARIHTLRRTEVTRWADAVAEAQRLFNDVETIKSTVSWRVTKPLRIIRAKRLQA